MKPGLLIAAVAVALSLLWWATTAGGVVAPRLPSASDQAEERATDRPPVEPRVALVQNEPETDTPASASPAHAFSVRLAGRVTDAHNGAPIRAATIKVDDRNAQTITDEAGRYALTFELSEVSAWLSAEHVDYTAAAERLDNSNVPATGSVTVDFELVPETAAAAVTGRFIEAGGSGIAGVEALLSSVQTARLDIARRHPHLSTRSGPQGRFAIPGLTAGTFTLFAIAPGHRDYQRLGIEVPPASRSDLGSIELQPFGWATLEGTIVDAQQRPIFGLRVEVRQGTTHRSADTDESGFYRIERILPGSWAVYFTEPGVHFRSDRLEFPEGGAVRRDLALNTGDHFIGGRLLIDGQPAPGFEVSCEPEQTDTADSWHRWIAVTDGEGRFRMTGLEDDSVSLYFQREIPWLVYESGSVAADREDHLFEFESHVRPVTVVGTVRTRDGAPLAGAKVAPPLPLSPAARAVTAVDGTYRIEVQATTDSSFRIFAESPGYLRQDEHLVARDADSNGVIQCDFTMTGTWSTGTVTGRVTDPQGRGIAQVAVLAVGADRTLWSCWTDSLGTYRLEDVVAGELQFRFSHRDYSTRQATHRLSAGQKLVVDAPLEALASLQRTVEVIDASGSAVVRQQVDVWDVRGAHIGGGRTDERGQVTITDLPAGPVRITADVEGHPRHELRHEIAGPQQAPLVLRLTVGGATITGVVHDPDGPLTEYEITLASTGDSPLRIYEIGSTDRRGRFRFDRLPEGEYELEVWTPSGKHKKVVRSSGGVEVVFRIE